MQTSRAVQVYDALAEWENVPGETDTLDFLSHMVRKLTGHHLEPFLNQCRHLDEENLVTTLSCALEKCYVTKEWLRIGDIAYWRQANDTGIGIVLSRSHLATPSKYTNGIVWIAMDYAQFGWRLDDKEGYGR